MSAWRYELPEDHAEFLRNSIDEGNIEAVAAAIKVSVDWIRKVVRSASTSYEIQEILEELEFVDDETTEEDIDYVLSMFYDLCDEYRIWIAI